MIRGRRRLLELAAIATAAAVIAGVLFRHLLFGSGVFVDIDLVLIHVPFRTFIADSISHGHLPLWTAQLWDGAPFAANGDAALFYPGQVLFFLAGAAHGYAWEMALHLGLSILAMYALARVGLRVSAPAALIAGLVFGLGGYAVSHQGFLSSVYSAPWPPLLLLGIVAAIDRSARWAWLIGPAIALPFLAGNPQELYWTALWGVPWLIAVVVTSGCSFRSVLPRLAAIAAASVVGLGLAAVQVLPQAEFLGQTVRGGAGLSFAEATQYPLPASPPWTVLLLDYRGLFGGENFGWIGIIGVGLAAIALLWLRRPGRRARIAFLLLMAAASYVLAMGAATPLYRVAYDFVPGMHDFRFPVRWIYPTSIALAGLAGLGADLVLGRFGAAAAWDRRRLVLAAACLGGGVVAAVAAYVVLDRSWVEHRHLLFASGSAVAITALAIMASRRAWLPRPAAGGLLALAMFLELFAGAQAFSWNRPMPDIYSASAPIPEYVSAHGGGRVVPGSANTDYSTSIRQMSANTPLLSGAMSVSGFGGNWPAARSAHFDQAVLVPLRSGDPAALAKTDLLRLLGARYLILDTARPGLAADPDLSLVARDGGFGLYELRQPGARAWTSCGASFLADSASALAAVTAPDFRVEHLYIEGAAVGSGELGACGTAAISGEDPDHVQVDVSMSRDGWLVLADSWDAGWEARVGGNAAEIRHADYFFRAVRVPAGAHQVSFDYMPKSFQLGALISLVSLLAGFAGLCLCLFWRRNRRLSG